jgi:hypothetical protein
MTCLNDRLLVMPGGTRGERQGNGGGRKVPAALSSPPYRAEPAQTIDGQNRHFKIRKVRGSKPRFGFATVIEGRGSQDSNLESPVLETGA